MAFKRSNGKILEGKLIKENEKTVILEVYRPEETRYKTHKGGKLVVGKAKLHVASKSWEVGGYNKQIKVRKSRLVNDESNL